MKKRVAKRSDRKRADAQVKEFERRDLGTTSSDPVPARWSDGPGQRRSHWTTVSSSNSAPRAQNAAWISDDAQDDRHGASRRVLKARHSPLCR